MKYSCFEYDCATETVDFYLNKTVGMKMRSIT